MASNINATKPTTGSPTTQSVRDNFSAAKNEINGILRSSLDVVSTTGSGNVYSANFSNNVVKAEGARIIVKANVANTGASTLNVDGTGASNILNLDGTALSAGQIAGNTHYLDLIYNSSNNSWVLLNPAIHTLAIADVTGLQSALNAKVSTSSYTAADVLTKLLTVDGTGTGLDADKIDGKHISTSQTGTDSNTIYFRT